VKAVSDLANRPIGISGRHRPFYALNLLDRLRGGQSLEESLRDRTVLMTGASSGIGEAAAHRIAAAGGTILLVARTESKLEALAGELEAAGGTPHVYPCNLADADALEALADDVLARHGGVDVLVNCAGRSIRRSIALSYDRPHDFERTMQLNYLAAVRLILRLLPGMRERGFGHVVNISSVGVQTRVPRFSGYIASKAALDTFSDAVQAEVLDDGVRFTTIHMPLVRTPMISPTNIYQRFPTLSPEEAGDLVADAIVHRPRRLGPPFGHLAALADALSPETMDFVRNQGYRMFPDSRAAKGEQDGAPEPPLSAQGAAFARATRGVHW
jgi:short-subunit dehydrogenase